MLDSFFNLKMGREGRDDSFLSSSGISGSHSTSMKLKDGAYSIGK